MRAAGRTLRTGTALSAVVLSAALAPAADALAAPVAAFPSPGDEVASPHSELSFRGTSRDRFHIAVVGSRSGRHAGRWRPHPDGHGVSFLPRRRFASGERVRVRVAVRVRGARGGRYSFRVATVPRQVGPPQIVVPPNTNPDVVRRFRSRPDLAPAAVEITVRRPGTARGLLLLAPKKGPGQSGPLIVDDAGQPVWDRPMPGRVKATDFRMQSYHGRKVLTWWQGRLTGGEGRGRGVIVDHHYRRVGTVRAGNGYAADLHEFELTRRGTALLLIYTPVVRDLTALGGSRRALVTDNVAQEVDVRTGRVLFEWHSLDHVGVRSSHFPRPQDPTVSWDYFHANALSSDADGDLLLTSRHVWAMYKLSRATGRVRWQLGGRGGTFRLGPGVRFAWAHDGRRDPDGRITLFDNEATPPVRAHSRAIAIRLDVRRRTATLVRSIVHPDGRRVASQGNQQTLPNGNLLVGWGSLGAFSEFAPDGTLLLDGRLPRSSDSYRVFRARWTGTPAGRPAVAAARSGRTVRVWASWNGATGISRWALLAGRSRDSLRLVASIRRTGFETRFTTRTRARYVAVRPRLQDGHRGPRSHTIAIAAAG